MAIKMKAFNSLKCVEPHSVTTESNFVKIRTDKSLLVPQVEFFSSHGRSGQKYRSSKKKGKRNNRKK